LGDAGSLEPVPVDPEVGVVVPPTKEILPEPVLGSAVAIFPGVIALKFHWVTISAFTEGASRMKALRKKQRRNIAGAPVVGQLGRATKVVRSGKIRIDRFTWCRLPSLRFPRS
jgi:hypothetical protein